MGEGDTVEIADKLIDRHAVKGVLWGTPRPVPAYRIICTVPWGVGHPSERKNLIRDLARAKGLPDRVGMKQAIAFFRQ